MTTAPTTPAEKLVEGEAKIYQEESLSIVILIPYHW